MRLAAKHGHADIVTALLENGADVNATNFNGRTALHYFAEQGHADIVTALLENGADVNVTDDFGQTALHLAAKEGHVVTVQAVVEHLQGDQGKLTALLNVQDNDGQTALSIAEEESHQDIVVIIDNIMFDSSTRASLSFAPNTTSLLEIFWGLLTYGWAESIFGGASAASAPADTAAAAPTPAPGPG